MNNEIELLLGLKTDEFNVDKTKEVEIKRLSKKTKTPFMIKVKSLPIDRIYELMDDTIDKNGRVVLSKVYDSALDTLCEALVSPDFDDTRLKVFLGLNEKCLKKEVLKKTLRVGEVLMLNDEIQSISGFDTKVENKIKN